MIRPRPEIVRTPPAVHGGPLGSADERTPVELDFSVSVNAWGPAEGVREAVRNASIDAYPDPECLAPRRAAARRWGVPLDEVAFGAGAAELLQALCFAFLRPGDVALIPGPTFGEYARAASLCGARLLQGTASPPHFRLDPSAIAAAVVEHRPRVAFLCAPNNPTGQPLSREQLGEVAEVCAERDTLLVIDQAYEGMSERPVGTPALPGHRAVVHLRSLTKDHALAGVRAAYAVGPPHLIAALERARTPWAASNAGQVAAVTALSEEGEAHLAATLPRLLSERARLEEGCARMGLRAVPSVTPFFLIRVGDAPHTRSRLLTEHGIKVRDCSSFGLPWHIRVSARTPEENQRLLRALEAVCSG